MKQRIPVRALVIDDDAAFCRKLHAWLEGAAYEVVTFTDPNAGLQHVTRAPCDLALVDLRLPNVAGEDVIASMRAASPQTRVVAMTAFPDAAQVIGAFRAGARDLLQKPIQQQPLLDALDRQLADIGIAARTETGFNRRLGARLRSVRHEAARTLQNVASQAGITAGQLSQIENGKTATSTWTLARICGALRVRLNTLFDGI